MTRGEAIALIKKLRTFHNGTYAKAIDMAIEALERKHGHWIQDRLCSTSGGTYGVRRCSVCEDYYQDIGYGWNYCPNCGAKMDESEGEDVF